MHPLTPSWKTLIKIYNFLEKNSRRIFLQKITIYFVIFYNSLQMSKNIAFTYLCKYDILVIETERGCTKMTWAVYAEHEGYVGDVSAPDRDTAVRFLEGQGYEPGSFELRELAE